MAQIVSRGPHPHSSDLPHTGVEPCSTWECHRIAAEEVRSKMRRLASEVGEPEGSNMPNGELFKKKYGMLAGNIIGTGTYNPTTRPRSTKRANRQTSPRSG